VNVIRWESFPARIEGQLEGIETEPLLGRLTRGEAGFVSDGAILYRTSECEEHVRGGGR